MKRLDKKSDCAINFSLEMFGDPWSLVIVRDIVYFGKKTYGEFLASDERIGTSVLARRLVSLEKKGILTKKPNKADKRKEVYSLTERGLDLIPILLDLADWGAHHDPQTGASQEWIAAIRTNRETMIEDIRRSVRSGGSLFGGSSRVTREVEL